MPDRVCKEVADLFMVATESAGLPLEQRLRLRLKVERGGLPEIVQTRSVEGGLEALGQEAEDAALEETIVFLSLGEAIESGDLERAKQSVRHWGKHFVHPSCRTALLNLRQLLHVGLGIAPPSARLDEVPKAGDVLDEGGRQLSRQQRRARAREQAKRRLQDSADGNSN